MNYNLFERSSSNTFGDIAEKLHMHEDFQLWGLPEGNIEKISKKFESTSIAEFYALYNGIIGIDVRWIVSELEWPWKNCVAKIRENSQVLTWLP